MTTRDSIRVPYANTMISSTSKGDFKYIHPGGDHAQTQSYSAAKRKNISQICWIAPVLHQGYEYPFRQYFYFPFSSKRSGKAEAEAAS